MPPHRTGTRGLVAALLALAGLVVAGCGGARGASPPHGRASNGTHAPAGGWADAHVHLSYEDASALDSLLAHGVSTVRDCGADFGEPARLRAEIRARTRRGPVLHLAGPFSTSPSLRHATA